MFGVVVGGFRGAGAQECGGWKAGRQVGVVEGQALPASCHPCNKHAVPVVAGLENGGRDIRVLECDGLEVIKA